MKFNRMVVVIAVTMFAYGALAETATETTVKEQKTTVSTSVSDSSIPTVAPIAAPPAASTVKPAPVAAEATETKVDAIKKVRQDVEQKNDSKIVEKLEKTRLDDEKSLANKIDSTNLKDDAQKQDAAAAPTVRIEKVEVIQPAAPIAPVEAKKEESKEEQKRIWYAGLGAGNIIYNGNTITKSNFGVLVGTMIDDHLAVEGSLIYSSFSLNNYWGGNGANNGLGNGLFGSMDQYDVGVAAKYYVLESNRFRPYVGASGDYLYRQYKDRYTYGYFYQNDNYTSGQNTNALNAGLLAGVDVKLTDRLLISGEFKYSLPIYSQENGLITQSYVMAYAKPLEQTSFTSWLLAVKFLF